MQIAWVFPGQGSQKLGMGKDVITLEGAKTRFDFASDIFGMDLFKICEEELGKNNDNDLNNTMVFESGNLLKSLKYKIDSVRYIT